MILDVLCRFFLILTVCSVAYLEHARSTNNTSSSLMTWNFVIGFIGYIACYDLMEYRKDGWATISWDSYQVQQVFVAFVPLVWAGICWLPTHLTVIKDESGSIQWTKLICWSAFYAVEAFFMCLIGGTIFGQHE